MDTASTLANNKLLPESLREQVMTVSTFVRLTNDALLRLGTAVVAGEISEINKNYSHCYFKLKDENSSTECTLFRNYLKDVPFTLETGQQVIVVGKSSLYDKNSRFSIIVTKVYMQGRGTLLERLEKLKLKLQKEGLFDEKRKLPLPSGILHKAGLVTSKEGAVVHDMKRTVSRRNPLIELKVFDTKVQGEDAPALIIKALKTAYLDKSLEVIILARGGGSQEDLLAFWDEDVARTVAASPVPIISAIGHEPDVVLTDYTASVRAATPTAAAELISTPTIFDIRDYLDNLIASLTGAVTGHLNSLGLRLDNLHMALKSSHPRLKAEKLSSRLMEICLRFDKVLRLKLLNCNDRSLNLIERLNNIRPEAVLLRKKETIHSLEQRLNSAVNKRLAVMLEYSKSLDARLARSGVADRVHLLNARACALTEKLIALNPLLVLKRGYGLPLKDGKAVKLEELKEGDEVTTMVAQGSFKSEVLFVSFETKPSQNDLKLD